LLEEYCNDTILLPPSYLGSSEDCLVKITDLTSTIVAVPLTHAHPSSLDVIGRAPCVSVTVEVQTDTGLVGVGESPVVTGAEICKAMIDSVKPQLLGEDPFKIEKIRRRLYAHVYLTHFHLHAANWAYSGIEMALWDIVGKACEQPLHRLWGGGYRDKVKFWGWVPHTKLSTIAAESKRLVREGYDTLYLKVGIDPKNDVASVKTIRDAVGYEVELRVDANQAWTPGTAVRLIRKMEKYDLEFVEQPVLMYNLDALAHVRKSVGTPILAHESSWTFHDALNVIKHEAADAIQLDPRFDGGLAGFRTAAGMAEAAGIGAVLHSFFELGITTAFFLHAVSSSPAFIYANQTLYAFLSDDVLKGGMMKFRNGHLTVPQKPGLGVELDKAKVEKYSKLYRNKVLGKEFEKSWGSPRKLLGLGPETEEWIPRAARW
jgi:L-alanine-DL-glutamate epimerase-like enolase superfamily enzyme